jgi:hypothetical protein
LREERTEREEARVRDSEARERELEQARENYEQRLEQASVFAYIDIHTHTHIHTHAQRRIHTHRARVRHTQTHTIIRDHMTYERMTHRSGLLFRRGATASDNARRSERKSGGAVRGSYGESKRGRSKGGRRRRRGFSGK